MRRTIRASNSPADDITVEIKSMFAAQPSASLHIMRHGVPEHYFSLHELELIFEIVCAATFDLKHAGVTA